ncbi:MAG: 2-dehydropantoate 2-reductase [Bifidobacteriaceae bacterium]|nr:2-dehydropantoate 2-reductase [Bifidobacteriaceae bacterium]
MDIAIIGTGAIGGYFGARLVHGGHTVHFLARSDAGPMRAHGLVVDSYLGDFTVPHPLVYTDVEALPPCDIVLITVKATGNRALLPHLGAATKKGGAIVLMQNGFGVEDKLAAAYPDARVFAGLCFICSFRTAPAHVKHTAYGRVSLAAQDGDVASAERLSHVFSDAGIDVEVLPDVLTARWRKLVWNMPYNGLSVALDCTTAELGTDPAAGALARAMMTEILEAAAACGVAIPAEFIEQQIATTTQMSAYEPSMKLDYLAGRPMEVGAIYDAAIAYARAHGYEMVRAEWLARTLDYLGAHNPHTAR